MKSQIIELLIGNSFSEYLKAPDLFLEHIRSGELADVDLDQEIIERLCTVMVIEKWAEHDDYIRTLQEYVDILPNYSSLFSDENVNYHLKGIAIFIDGLGQGTYNVNGFIYPSHSGYLMSHTASNKISEYLRENNKEKDADFFEEMSEWFNSINLAQYSLITALTEIKEWNESMALGFFNILTGCELYFQSWLLGSLYKVVEHPIVKKDIFDKYLGVLYKIKDKYNAEGSTNNLRDIETIIKMVTEKSFGK